MSATSVVVAFVHDCPSHCKRKCCCSQLEQELKKVKQEQDARVDIEVKAVQRFLQTQHQEAIAVVEARLTEANVALQAEQDRRQAAEQARADYETEAKGIVNTWKTHYVALQGQAVCESVHVTMKSSVK